MTTRIYKKVGNEVYVIPVVGNPPTPQLLKEEKPALPHQNEKIDFEGLRKLRELKERWNTNL